MSPHEVSLRQKTVEIRGTLSDEWNTRQVLKFQRPKFCCQFPPHVARRKQRRCLSKQTSSHSESVRLRACPQSGASVCSAGVWCSGVCEHRDSGSSGRVLHTLSSKPHWRTKPFIMWRGHLRHLVDHIVLVPKWCKEKTRQVLPCDQTS